MNYLIHATTWLNLKLILLGEGKPRYNYIHMTLYRKRKEFSGCQGLEDRGATDYKEEIFSVMRFIWSVVVDT